LVAIAFAGVTVVAKDLQIVPIKGEVRPQLARLYMIHIENDAMHLGAATATLATASAVADSVIPERTPSPHSEEFG
jgi:hypothetical protein